MISTKNLLSAALVLAFNVGTNAQASNPNPAATITDISVPTALVTDLYNYYTSIDANGGVDSLVSEIESSFPTGLPDSEISILTSDLLANPTAVVGDVASAFSTYSWWNAAVSFVTSIEPAVESILSKDAGAFSTGVMSNVTLHTTGALKPTTTTGSPIASVTGSKPTASAVPTQSKNAAPVATGGVLAVAGAAAAGLVGMALL